MTKRILILGDGDNFGGREHALAWKLAGEAGVRVFVAPGNLGTSGKNYNSLRIDTRNLKAVDLAMRVNSIDLAVYGPEAPLVRGDADILRSLGHKVFGPGSEGARLEGSKAYAKDFLLENDIPTAQALVCQNLEEIETALKAAHFPLVLKADGLAAGKGVVICDTWNEAMQRAPSLLAKGSVVVEEFLTGTEASLMVTVDTMTGAAIPFIPICDYKKIHDSDLGDNTGGMGAYGPTRLLPTYWLDETMITIVEPTVAALRRWDIDYRGVLYFGLMITKKGTFVLEFNSRFGDPETQVLMRLLHSSLYSIMYAAACGNLKPDYKVMYKRGAAVAVTLASPGYPRLAETGHTITGLDTFIRNGVVFHAGTRKEGDQILTSGGRVAYATGFGTDLYKAREIAYMLANSISFTGKQQRSDIALREIR